MIEEDVYMPDDVGDYYWDDDDMDWYDVNERIKTLKNEIDSLNFLQSCIKQTRSIKGENE